MLSFIDRFIQDWGYIALFFGALIEGESIVLTVSSMCYYGKFSLPKVMIIAFLGTLFADQVLFYVGRFLGPKIFKTFPSLKERSKRAFFLLDKYQVPFILSFRFIYGIRIISPVVVGISNVGSFKYTILNVFSAIIWTILSCGLGYFIGAFGSLIGVNNSSIGILFSFIIVVLVIVFFHLFNKSNLK
jgi:membrane protein DedA with SNARE-associated domain